MHLSPTQRIYRIEDKAIERRAAGFLCHFEVILIQLDYKLIAQVNLIKS